MMNGKRKPGKFKTRSFLNQEKIELYRFYKKYVTYKTSNLSKNISRGKDNRCWICPTNLNCKWKSKSLFSFLSHVRKLEEKLQKQIIFQIGEREKKSRLSNRDGQLKLEEFFEMVSYLNGTNNCSNFKKIEPETTSIHLNTEIGNPPIENSNAPRPIENINEPEPVEYSNEPKPVEYSNEPKPVEFSNEPKPVEYSNEPKPVEYSNASQLIENSNAPQSFGQESNEIVMNDDHIIVNFWQEQNMSSNSSKVLNQDSNIRESNNQKSDSQDSNDQESNNQDSDSQDSKMHELKNQKSKSQDSNDQESMESFDESQSKFVEHKFYRVLVEPTLNIEKMTRSNLFNKDDLPFDEKVNQSNFDEMKSYLNEIDKKNSMDCHFNKFDNEKDRLDQVNQFIDNQESSTTSSNHMTSIDSIHIVTFENKNNDTKSIIIMNELRSSIDSKNQSNSESMNSSESSIDQSIILSETQQTTENQSALDHQSNNRDVSNQPNSLLEEMPILNSINQVNALFKIPPFFK